MSSNWPTRLDMAAAIGLAIGGVFGLAGTFVGEAGPRQELWAIDGVALVVATALLTMKFARSWQRLRRGGLSRLRRRREPDSPPGNAAGLQGSVPSYAGGVALWSASLAMTSIPPTFAAWTRLTGVIAAVLFAVTAAMLFWGAPLLPTSAPLPTIGYPFLVLTFAGWIWRLVRPLGVISERPRRRLNSRRPPQRDRGVGDPLRFDPDFAQLAGRRGDCPAKKETGLPGRPAADERPAGVVENALAPGSSGRKSGRKPVARMMASKASAGDLTNTTPFGANARDVAADLDPSRADLGDRADVESGTRPSSSTIRRGPLAARVMPSFLSEPTARRIEGALMNVSDPRGQAPLGDRQGQDRQTRTARAARC